MARVQKRPSTYSQNKDVAHPFRDSSPKIHRLGARSCRGCHQRKVRCDRGVPCTNCSRCGITCEYPTKDTSAARKDPTPQNIYNRLEQLENLLLRFIETSQATRGSAASGGSESQTLLQLQPGANGNAIGPADPHSSNQHTGESTWELLLDDGQAVRQTNNSNIEILLQDEDKIDITRPSSSKAALSDPQNSTNSHCTYPARPDASAPLDLVSDVLKFYPDSRLALQLWNVYVKSVDPVLKILHIPTVQSTVVTTILDPKSAQSSTLALTFAIFYAAVTALCHDDDDNEHIDLSYEKHELLDLYKVSLDRLLAVPNLMSRPDIAALQALTIYATCLRVHEVGRGVWVLTGLAIRVAQSINLHLDGAWLQLSPFETEMRLRLWWHLCILESRAPEDQGFNTTVDVTNRQLRLPLNINDNQIYPGIAQLPAESDSWTEMSFFLIQTASCRLLHPILDIQKQHSADPLLNIIEKRKTIIAHGQHLSAKFGGVLSGSGEPTGLSCTALQHIITARKKMEFVLQLREEILMQNQDRGQDKATPDIRKLSFKLACDGLESSRVLLKEGLASRFKWFFNMYTQWYALAYILRCLPSSPCSSEADRAWTLVEELFPREKILHSLSAGTHDEQGRGSISRYLILLRSNALLRRQEAQLSVATVATAGVENQSFGSGEHCTSRLPPNSNIPPSTGTTALGASTLPESGQKLVADSNQSIFSSLDLSMPEIPFLPDWNAVINGCLNDDSHSINPADDNIYPSDTTQFWSSATSVHNNGPYA